MLENYNDVLTIKDIQAILHIGRNSAYRLIKTNAVKHIRVGNKILIPKKYIIEFLETA